MVRQNKTKSDGNNSMELEMSEQIFFNQYTFWLKGSNNIALRFIAVAIPDLFNRQNSFVFPHHCYHIQHSLTARQR